MKTTPCKGCGKPIAWGTTPEGKQIPLDPRPPVYVVGNLEDENPVAVRLKVAMISHFATCPKASEFSGGRK